MRRVLAVTMGALFGVVALVLAQHGSPVAHFYPLDSTRGLRTGYGITMESTVYRGRKAVELIEPLDPDNGDLAVIDGVEFKNGAIDLDVAARLTDNAGGGSRGFIGIAFHVSDDLQKYESFYLRMTNGRSPDPQLRKHAVQYCSIPGFTWDYLRGKKPGLYEAHTDLVLGEWTHIHIAVRDGDATFWVGKDKRPTLTVHGLLGGQDRGKLALWVHAHTRAYFANLEVRES